MIPWDVNVQVPVNGHSRKILIELRHNGELVDQDKRDLEQAKERTAVVNKFAELTKGEVGADDLEKMILAELDRGMRRARAPSRGRLRVSRRRDRGAAR